MTGHPGFSLRDARPRDAETVHRLVVARANSRFCADLSARFHVHVNLTFVVIVALASQGCEKAYPRLRWGCRLVIAPVTLALTCNIFDLLQVALLLQLAKLSTGHAGFNLSSVVNSIL